MVGPAFRNGAALKGKVGLGWGHCISRGCRGATAVDSMRVQGAPGYVARVQVAAFSHQQVRRGVRKLCFAGSIRGSVAKPLQTPESPAVWEGGLQGSQFKDPKG